MSESHVPKRAEGIDGGAGVTQRVCGPQKVHAMEQSMEALSYDGSSEPDEHDAIRWRDWMTRLDDAIG